MAKGDERKSARESPTELRKAWGMILVDVLRLTRWELFKLRKRWMPLIILGIVILIAQVALWGAYIAYRTTDIGEALKVRSFGGRTAADVWECREIEHPRDVCEDQERSERLYRKFERPQFILPLSLANSLGFAQIFGVILVPILAASAIGAEYGWGTLRAILMRRPSRWKLLLAKFCAVMLLVVAGLLILSLTNIMSSLIVAWLSLSDGFRFADSGKWASVWLVFGKTIYSLVPYVLLAIFFTVLTSSAVFGTALVLGYYFIELFAAGALFDRFGHISDFLLGPSFAGWMEGTGGAQTPGVVVLIPLSNLPGSLDTFLILLAYIVVLGAATIWLFQRKEIGGSKSA